MRVIPGDEPRRVVPRWRDSRRAASLGETSALAIAQAKGLEGDAELAAALADLREHPSEVGFHTDAISIALVLNKTELAKELAAKLLSTHTPEEHNLRARIFSEIGGPPPSNKEAPKTGAAQNVGRELVTTEIRALKAMLVTEPSNAIAWADIALRYSSLGQEDKSKESMRRAQALAPDDRFILRSAARLLLHVGDEDEALWMLRGHPRTKLDPWLLSAEVAAASILGKSPLFIKEARQALKQGAFPPRSLSELRAGLGSLEIEASNYRQARKLLVEATENGTENAAAQVVWARSRVGWDGLPEATLAIPDSYEARSRAAFENERWSDALEEALAWFADEPFATRPAATASFTAAVVLGQHALASSLLERALQANPNDQTLLNNAAFSLASLGRIKEARQKLDRLGPAIAEDGLDVAVLATRGLVEFRSGNVAEGQKLYLRAGELAHERRDEAREALAKIFLGRELALTGVAGGPEVLAEADLLIKKMPRARAASIAAAAARVRAGLQPYDDDKPIR